MLVENTLFGEENKIEKAIDRLKFAYDMSEKQSLGALYVAFSGGKDSVCIAELCRLSGVPYELHYNMTGIDPPDVINFMKENYPYLIWHKFEKSMFQLIVEKHLPPTRLIRFCCSELKERGGKGRMCVTGVRWSESTRRKKTRKYFETFDKEKMLFNDNEEERELFEQCNLKGKFVVNPIIDWTENDVWEFIHKQKLPYCSLYDVGFTRIGCIGCPMAPLHQREKAFERWPGFKKAYIKTFELMLDKMPNKEKCTWKTGEDVFNWWLYGSSKQENDNYSFLEDFYG